MTKSPRVLLALLPLTSHPSLPSPSLGSHIDTMQGVSLTPVTPSGTPVRLYTDGTPEERTLTVNAEITGEEVCYYTGTVTMGDGTPPTTLAAGTTDVATSPSTRQIGPYTYAASTDATTGKAVLTVAVGIAGVESKTATLDVLVSKLDWWLL